MGFIMEFAENLILRLMEDPKERDRQFREHISAKSPAVGTPTTISSKPPPTSQLLLIPNEPTQHPSSGKGGNLHRKLQQ
ncbi:hypothetical protein AAC387_Pa03g3736 [Persea americana]